MKTNRRPIAPTSEMYPCDRMKVEQVADDRKFKKSRYVITFVMCFVIVAVTGALIGVFVKKQQADQDSETDLQFGAGTALIILDFQACFMGALRPECRSWNAPNTVHPG